MIIESIIVIAAYLIAIGGSVVSLYKKLKKRSMTELNNQLVDKTLSNKQHSMFFFKK